MVKRKFGWTNVEVPIVGQGTWMIEGSQAQEQRAVAALRLGLDLGLTHIDTAEMYGNGRAEELTAEAVGHRRSDVFLVSKVLPSNASYDGTLRACERSLKRLRTDILDLYLLHWSGRHPIRETMRAMETLVNRRFIRFIGVSNLDLDELKEAQRALRHERLACNQVLYHLGDRGIEYPSSPLLRRPTNRRGGLQSLRSLTLSLTGQQRRRRFGHPCPQPRTNGQAGGAEFSHPPCGSVHHSESKPEGACAGKQPVLGVGTLQRGPGSHQRSLSLAGP